jgi:hypothetical protein
VGYSQARLNGRPTVHRDSPARVISEEGGGDSLVELGRGRDNRDRARQMSQRDTTLCGASAPAWLRTNGDTDEPRAPDAIDVHGVPTGVHAATGSLGLASRRGHLCPLRPYPVCLPVRRGVAKLPA